MIEGLIWVIVSMAGFVAGIFGVKFLLQPASSLRLNVFRPWRGDPWPRGVQEEYDAPFDWSVATRRRAPIAQIAPSWDDIVVTPTVAGLASHPDVVGSTPEELHGEAVIVEHLGSVSIHHPGR